MSEDRYIGTISKHEMVVDRYDYERMEEQIDFHNLVIESVDAQEWAEFVGEALTSAHPSDWCSWGDCPKCKLEHESAWVDLGGEG